MTAEAPIYLAGALLEMPRHVCAFFHNADEEYQVLLPFVTEGVRNGEKAFHIVDPELRTDHARRLASAGIDVAACELNGQLEVRVWEEAYLRGGHFDQNAMLSLIEEVLQNGYAQGYGRTRLLAHMEWALQDRPGVDDLLEYETRLNYILPRYRDPVV